MKHFFLLAAICHISVLFANIQIGDLCYNLDLETKTAEVIHCANCSSSNWSTSITTANIPASVTYNGVTYRVTSIGNGAFKDCTNLTSVNIPNSITSIGHCAFCDCTSMESIKIPNSVTSIGTIAFSGCSSLTSMTIPNSVYKLGDWAFLGCHRLKELRYYEGLDITSAYVPETTKIEILKGISSNLPPFLSLVDCSLVYLDVSGNNRLDANENNSIKFKISNQGKGAAYNCETRVKMSGTTDGITVVTSTLPTIAIGQTYDVAIPLSTDINTKDGKVTFAIEIYEPNGWGVAPFEMTIATKAYEPPFLQVVDYNISSTTGKIQKMIPFTLSFNLQNTKYGDAEFVKVKINLPSNVFVMDGYSDYSFPLLKSGEVKKISVMLAANNNYPTTNIPITIDVRERYGKFAENKQLNIALNQAASSSVNIAAKEEPKQERKEIKLALMTSDVDRNISKNNMQNKNTFAVIIANENYQQVASVPFALNDGKVFRQYCEQTLGIPAKNIREQTNATGNQIKAVINWLYTVVEVFDNPNIIFYYAGHGIPDEKSKTAYLLPVDGIISDLSTCYKLDDLYTTLGEMPVGHISVFMDACFSGSKREQGMLASARGVALKARPGQPHGNMVVFSAAQGDETAFPYVEQQHGMFTYYLLKKLQESKGDVTLAELRDYIIKNVSQQSVVENNKKQTPCVTPSTTILDSWQNWKIQ